MSTVGIASATETPTSAQSGRPEILEVVDRHNSEDRGDEPGGAAEYYLLKRRGPTPDHDRIRALQAARRRMDRMPVHSITLHSFATEISARGWFGTAQLAGTALVGQLGAARSGQHRRPDPVAGHPPGEPRHHVRRRGLRRGVEDHRRRPELVAPRRSASANIAINSMAMDPSDPGDPLRRHRRGLLPRGGARHLAAAARRGDLQDHRRRRDLAAACRQPTTRTSTGSTTWSSARNHPTRLYAATRTGVWRSDNARRRLERGSSSPR